MQNGKEGDPATPEDLMPDSVREAHAWSIRNEYLIRQSNWCGCFYCRHVFKPPAVKEWIREPSDQPDATAVQRTAVCPACGIDAVLPDSKGRHYVGQRFLTEMRDYWFGEPTWLAAEAIEDSDFLRMYKRRLAQGKETDGTPE